MILNFNGIEEYKPNPLIIRPLMGLSELLNYTFFKSNLEGVENINPQTPNLLLPNHYSFFDIPLLACPLNERCGRYIYWVGKQSLPNVLSRTGTIPIITSKNIRKCSKKEREYMLKYFPYYISELFNNEENVVLFPEGTRNKNGTIQINQGVPKLIKKIAELTETEINVHYVGINYHEFPSLKKPFKNRVDIKISKPEKIESIKSHKTIEEKLNRILKGN